MNEIVNMAAGRALPNVLRVGPSTKRESQCSKRIIGNCKCKKGQKKAYLNTIFSK